MEPSEERPGDRKLWASKQPPRLVRPAENDRVRPMLVAALELAVEADNRDVSDADKWGRARKDFARDWVRLAKKLGLRPPGEEQRKSALPGDDIEDRHADSAHKHLRWLMEGGQLYDWMLVGIESVCCDRLDMALPGKAYQVQQKLKV